MEQYQCIYEGKIAEINANLINLKDGFQEFKDNDFHEVKEDIRCLVKKINKPRLPMSITWVLTLCSGLIIGLIVKIMK